jgi:DNA-binding MarR family transcriptional regulator
MITILVFQRNVGMSVLDMAGHLIRRLHQQSTQVFVQRTQAAGFDLTPIQYAALEAIYENPGIDQARVAEMIGYDRATIGGVIERLEKKGWLRRLVSEQDRRARELSLTPKGNKIRAALEPIVEDLQKDILQPLSEADRKSFIHLARQVVLLGGAT